MDDSCFNGNFKTKDECHLYADKRRLDSRDLRCACQFDRDFSGSVPAPTGPRSRSPGRCCCAVWSDHGTLHRGLKIQSGRRIRYSFYLGVQVSDCRLLLYQLGHIAGIECCYRSNHPLRQDGRGTTLTLVQCVATDHSGAPIPSVLPPPVGD
jgi:hypothetical protein